MDKPSRITFGGWDGEIVTGNITWEKLKSPYFWTIEGGSAKYAGVDLGDMSTALLDTGTTFTLLPTAVYNKFQ